MKVWRKLPHPTLPEFTDCLEAELDSLRLLEDLYMSLDGHVLEVNHPHPPLVINIEVVSSSTGFGTTLNVVALMFSTPEP